MKTAFSTIVALALSAGTALHAPLANAELGATVARPAAKGPTSAYDGVVEAVRQSTMAAQVSGTVVEVKVKAGDRVSAGQVLIRLDARAATQNAAASAAQARAARATQEVAAKEFARQQQLATQRFISAAALDRAEAEYKAAQAQAAAQVAQADAATTQSGFYVVRAPYAGVVADVPVMLGDMAMPGRVLVTLYDPTALRVSAAVPLSAAGSIGEGSAVRAEIPALANATARVQTPQHVQVLPAADASTHTVIVRAELVPGLTSAMPGQFARIWLPTAEAGDGRLWVPISAVVRRAEMTGLYVFDANGRPLLRQVRLGRSDGAQVEVLSGLMAGERVATDTQAAARMTALAK
jgi:membrane fusion protein, multidrug efflux system